MRNCLDGANLSVRSANVGVEMIMTRYSVKFGPCCFCGCDIESTGVDPCQVTVGTEAGKWQTWSCHARCFKARLTDPPEAPGFFEPAHF